MEPKKLTLVRVVAPHFVAAFETDDHVVVRAAPILSKRFVGLTVETARKVIAHFGWKASVIQQQPCGECHLQPGEVCDICGAHAAR